MTAETAAPPPETRFRRFRQRLDFLYHADHPAALRFQGTVAILDLVIIGFFIVSPLIADQHYFFWVDYSVAALLGADLLARLVASPNWRAWARRPVVWVDVLVFLTLLAPAFFLNFGFLRILRLWTLAQKEIVWRWVRAHGWREWEDVGRALVNLLTCLFLITGFVYTAFARSGSGMEGYVDALYFTVATVTTTGFGDITLPGTAGKLTSIVTMIVGISLFVRLAQALFKPYKVFFRCPQCALERHEPDAVHCKACGHILAIPDEGA